MRIAVRVIDGVNYLVIEWLNVKRRADELEPNIGLHRYSFQLIIEENSENIWFNYLEVPALPSYASIGAENYDGRLGTNLYYDGEGIGLPTPISGDGYSLKLVYQPEGVVNIDYELVFQDKQNFTQADKYEAIEETETTFDVLENDKESNNITVQAQLNSGTYQLTAYRNKEIAIEGGLIQVA